MSLAMCVFPKTKIDMRIINLLLSSLFAMLVLSACQQRFEEAPTQENLEKLYVTFTIDGAERRETRAVPNAPNGTESDGDYESSYKSVDVMFFESNGNIATVGGQRIHHFDSEGFSPNKADKENWVGGKYERGENKRGVFLLGVNRNQVQGKTCVVVLNLPLETRSRVESGNISSLTSLKNAAVIRITSADEQLGPIPYPLGANNQPDYNSPAFRHIVMIGETSNISIPDTDLASVINVNMERTIAKVNVVGYFSGSTFSLFPGLGYTKITMSYLYKNFPSRTHLGSFWVEPGRAGGMVRNPVNGIFVESPAKLYGKAKQPYFVQNFYMNEYGELPDNAADQPIIELSALFQLPSNPDINPQHRNWVLSLPRGMQRNKSYTIYVNITGNGSPNAGGNTRVVLKADKIVVAPWAESIENFSLPESYPLKNFIGSPINSNDQI